MFGLTTEQLEEMTIREYKAKREGFFDYHNNQLKQQAWLIGLMAAKAVNASKKCPYPSLEEFMGDKEKPQETDEELWQAAKDKGLVVPEGVL